MGNEGLSEKVLAYLLEYRNQTVALGQIVAATRLTAEQVQRTVNNLRNKKKDLYLIDIVIRGRAWMLRDVTEEPNPDKRVFEEVGPTKDGRIVIQDSEGSLYTAIPL